jgi:hypothetical protein
MSKKDNYVKKFHFQCQKLTLIVSKNDLKSAVTKNRIQNAGAKMSPVQKSLTSRALSLAAVSAPRDSKIHSDSPESLM